MAVAALAELPAYATPQAAFVANECVRAPPSAGEDGYSGLHVQQTGHRQVPRHMGPGFEMHFFELDADGALRSPHFGPAHASFSGWICYFAS